jgi:hypothetical protein
MARRPVKNAAVPIRQQPEFFQQNTASNPGLFLCLIGHSSKSASAQGERLGCWAPVGRSGTWEAGTLSCSARQEAGRRCPTDKSVIGIGPRNCLVRSFRM